MQEVKIGSKCPKDIGIIGMLKHVERKEVGTGCDAGSVCCHMCKHFHKRVNNEHILCGPPSNEYRVKDRKKQLEEAI